MQRSMRDLGFKWCASVTVAGAALLTSCSAAPTAAPFDPGAPAAATAREDATRVAAAQQTQIAAPAATAAYQSQSDSLDLRERALHLSEQESQLVVRQQQDAIELERQRALIPPLATQAQAGANTQIAVSQAAGALPILGLIAVVAGGTGALLWLFNLQRREKLKTEAEEERTKEQKARRIEAEAKALAPREPVPGFVQIYNVQMGVWMTQPRPPSPAGQPFVVESQASITAPSDTFARKSRWHRELYHFARHIERRQASGETSRRLMKVDGICEEDTWNVLSDALASVGAIVKRQGVRVALAPGVTSTFIRDQFQTGYWALPPALYETEPPKVGAVVNPGGIVEVDAEPA